MEIKATDGFIRSVRKIARKYRSFNQDYQEFLSELEENPRMGVDLGEGYRKVRMAIKSKGKGKSGGARVITLDMVERNGILYLIYGYDKSESDNVDLRVIKEIVSGLSL